MKNTARLRRLQAAIAEPARMIVIDERKGEVAEQERRMRAVDEFERSRCSAEQAAAPTASLRRRRTVRRRRPPLWRFRDERETVVAASVAIGKEKQNIGTCKQGDCAGNSLWPLS